MLSIALLLLAQASARHTTPFEISSNKPFIRVTVEGSSPQWFILDTGCRGASVARQLQIRRGDRKLRIPLAARRLV